MSKVHHWGIEGSWLVFWDKDNIKRGYRGDTTSIGVELTGNVGVVRDWFYYKDEDNFVRYLPTNIYGLHSAQVGTVWIEDSKINYINESGERVVAPNPTKL